MLRCKCPWWIVTNEIEHTRGILIIQHSIKYKEENFSPENLTIVLLYASQEISSLPQLISMKNYRYFKLFVIFDSYVIFYFRIFHHFVFNSSLIHMNFRYARELWSGRILNFGWQTPKPLFASFHWNCTVGFYGMIIIARVIDEAKLAELTSFVRLSSF